MSFTQEQLQAAEYGKDFAWSARTVPDTFDPVQLETGGTSGFCEWWNPRGTFLSCCFPFLRCLSNHQKVDAKDLTEWKKQLANPSNKDCPESMQGLWWLRYNHAPEELVTIFGDGEWKGTFNKEGTRGYGEWSRPLRNNWSRENSLFGLGFSIWGMKETAVVKGRMNLEDGICTVHGARGEGIQIIYRMNDNEWWKIHYAGNPGEDGEQDIEFMYKWLKVVDKDGNPTEHWEEWLEWVDEPLPYQGCGCGDYKSFCWPFWACCLSGKEVSYNMARPNKTQVVNFRV